MTVYILLTGMWFAGAVAGAFTWDQIRTDSVRRAYERRLRSADSRELMWKRMALYAEGEKAALADRFPNDSHSRKVVPLRGVS